MDYKHRSYLRNNFSGDTDFHPYKYAIKINFATQSLLKVYKSRAHSNIPYLYLFYLLFVVTAFCFCNCLRSIEDN